MVFLCRLPLPLRAAARRSSRHDSFDMSSLMVPLLEQTTVVPSEPQARSLSRNAQSQSSTSTRNVSLRRQTSRQTNVRIVQKQDNVAHGGVISMESLCLRLGMRTVTRALHAQPDRCVRGTTRPFAHHLIRHFNCRTRVAQARMNALAKNWSSQLQQGDLMVLTLT